MGKFIPKYKYFSNDGYKKIGYVRVNYISNLICSLRGKDSFEIRAFLVGDSNAQIIGYGTKEECYKKMDEIVGLQVPEE